MSDPGIYAGIDLIGGGVGAIDKINGNVLNDKDIFLTTKNGILYPHWLDDDSGAAEDSPRIISPDLNAGTKRWLLAGLFVGSIITKSPKVNIMAFGADPTGASDSSVAIQKAIDYIRVTGSGCLFIPIGVFKVETSLDCTGFLGAEGDTYKGLHIEGVSMNGSRILGATSGKPVFDFTASGYCSIDKLRITGHSSDTPNVAILLARNSGAASAGVHNFRRLFVEGEFTKGGIYNYASEENVFDNIRITITGGGATFCISFCETNFESISSDYETIHPTGHSMTRITLLAPQLKMVEDEATGTCLSLYGDVRDLDCYGAYMYSRAQSHVRMYSPASGNPPYRISFRNLRAEGYVTTSKPDYSIFMTGATTGSFNNIRIEDSYLDAYIYEIYQDNTASGTFMGEINRVRTVNGLEMKFNKVRDSKISLLIGDLTIDTSVHRTEITNYYSGTISLPATKESVFVNQYHTDHLSYTEQIRRADSIETLDNTGTPSVALGNNFKTGGTEPITDLDDGVTGQIVRILAEHATPIIDGTNILLSDSGNWTMAVTDALVLLCKADNKWYEQSRSLAGTNETVTTGSPALTLAGTTKLDSSGGAITGTLADGEVIGGEKTIIMVEASTSSTITVTHHITEDPEVFTFAEVGDSLLLKWNGTDWMTVFNNGVAV